VENVLGVYVWKIVGNAMLAGKCIEKKSIINYIKKEFILQIYNKRIL